MTRLYKDCDKRDKGAISASRIGGRLRDVLPASTLGLWQTWQYLKVTLHRLPEHLVFGSIAAQLAKELLTVARTFVRFQLSLPALRT